MSSIVRRHPSRRLSQPNALLLLGIQSGLEAVEGGPTQLDVLGFDACLMQAVGALDEYNTIAKYYMASEAVEPGTGKKSIHRPWIVWL